MSAELPKHPTWMVQARTPGAVGMPTLFVHACGAELERVGVRMWQLSFAGQHRSFTARSAPIDAAERAIEEIAKQIMTGPATTDGQARSETQPGNGSAVQPAPNPTEGGSPSGS